MPDGLDDAGVSVAAAQNDNVAALVSRLDHPDYEPATLEERSGDVEWLSPRAMAHDRVLTWASDRGAVVPLPMFSLFSGERAVQSMLRDRAEQSTATLEQIGALASTRCASIASMRSFSQLVPELSPRIQKLAATAAAAVARPAISARAQADGEKRSEIRTVTQQVVDDVARRVARECARCPAIAHSAHVGAECDARHDGAERGVSRDAGRAAGFSKNAHDARRRSRKARASASTSPDLGRRIISSTSRSMASDARHDALDEIDDDSSSSAIC